jgi:hypothetical protein
MSGTSRTDLTKDELHLAIRSLIEIGQRRKVPIGPVPEVLPTTYSGLLELATSLRDELNRSRDRFDRRVTWADLKFRPTVE